MNKLHFASTKDGNMFYKVKSPVPDAFFYLETASQTKIFLDHRELGVFQEKNTNPNVEAILLNPLQDEAVKTHPDYPGTSGLALLLINKYLPAGEPINIPATFPLPLADFLRAQKINLVITEPFNPNRLTKTEAEKNLIKQALNKTYPALDRVQEILRQSVIVGEEIHYQNKVLTSEFLKREAEKVLIENGMMSIEDMIISSAEQAAIPHHPGAGPVKPRSTIICDFFPRDTATGYFADITRTFFKGEPKPEAAKMYQSVLTAQTKAIAAIKPGPLGKEINQVSIDQFLGDGFHEGDRGFIHGTGHGLGVDIHEEPYLNKRSNTPLATGHVVTVEPGLYYPEFGGVRIEDVVIVTENGNENLTTYPKEFTIL